MINPIYLTKFPSNKVTKWIKIDKKDTIKISIIEIDLEMHINQVLFKTKQNIKDKPKT